MTQTHTGQRKHKEKQKLIPHFSILINNPTISFHEYPQYYRIGSDNSFKVVAVRGGEINVLLLQYFHKLFAAVPPPAFHVYLDA